MGDWWPVDRSDLKSQLKVPINDGVRDAVSDPIARAVCTSLPGATNLGA